MREVSRRRLIAGTALAAGAAAVSACGYGDEPSVDTPVFVLVGGSASPSFYWMPIVRELALRGARSYPVELPGHGLDSELPISYQSPQDTTAFARAGTPVAGKTLGDYADVVADAVTRTAASGPVILVGHSLGGPIITRAANSVADQIAGLVYISAIAVSPGGTPLTVFAAPENTDSLAAILPPSIIDTAATGVTRTNLRSADTTFLRSYRDAVMADFPEQQFLAALNYPQQPDESVLPTLEDIAADPDTWGRIPRTFVRLTADRWHTPALQDAMIRAPTS